MIRVVNGSDFIIYKLDNWVNDAHVTLAFIQPGEPTQNAFVERCNRSLHEVVLNAYVFRTFEEVRQKVEELRIDYNEHRPHKSLNYKTPIELMQ